MARLQLAGDLRVSGFRVLDELRLIEDDAVKLVLEQDCLVARQQRVGRDDQIVLRNALELSFASEAVEHEHTQRRGKALGLLSPVGHETGGGDDQAGTVRAAAFFFCQQMGEGLHGFAQTHVVREDAGQLVCAEKLQPVKALLLIGPQSGVESGRRRDRFDAVETAQAPAELTQFGVAEPTPVRFARQFGGAEFVQAQPALSVERVGIEQFEQHTEHLAGAAGRERKSSAIRQGDREDGVLRQFGQRFAVQRVGAGLEKLDQDRQQVDLLAVQQHSQFNAEPVVAVVGCGIAIPILRLGEAKPKAVVGVDSPALVPESGQD